MNKKDSSKKERLCPHKKFSTHPQGFRVWFISAYLFIAGGVTITFNILFTPEGFVLRNNLIILLVLFLLSAYEVRR